MPSSAVMTTQKKKLDMAAQSLTPGERLQRALELSELCRALRECGREAVASEGEARRD